MRVEVETGAVSALAPRLTGLGQDVDALCAAVVPEVGAAVGACGEPSLAAAVGELAGTLNGGLQAAVLSLTALGDAVIGAARTYLTTETTVRRGMRAE